MAKKKELRQLKCSGVCGKVYGRDELCVVGNRMYCKKCLKIVIGKTQYARVTKDGGKFSDIYIVRRKCSVCGRAEDAEHERFLVCHACGKVLCGTCTGGNKIFVKQETGYGWKKVFMCSRCYVTQRVSELSYAPQKQCAEKVICDYFKVNECKDRKDVNGKQRWDLLPFDALEEVVKRFTYGARRYKDNGYDEIADKRAVYLSALLRHLSAWRRGEEIDEDSGLTHIGAVACNALILCHFEVGGVDDKQTGKTE